MGKGAASGKAATAVLVYSIFDDLFRLMNL
jgi:hypothetical protein